METNMKKLIVIVAALISFGIGAPAHAEGESSFNEQSYNKVTVLSQAIESFRKVSANGELSTLEMHMKTIQEKANILAGYDIASEVPGDNDYKTSAEALKTAAIKLETVSKKMAEAAADDDDSLFVSYQKEYNSAVDEFNGAIKSYAATTERAVERVRLEQMAIIGLAVLTGIITIAFWFWASSDNETNKVRVRARRLVAIASILPFAGALITLGLYLLHVISGYMIWLPIAVGILALLIAWIVYLIRRRRFAGFSAA